MAWGWGDIFDTPEKALERRIKKSQKGMIVRNLLIRSILTVSCVYLLFGIIAGIGIVRGTSMTPALNTGDVFLFWRVVEEYKVEDIVLLKVEGNNDLDFVKRVVGVPGDVIDMKNGQLLINGEVVEEEHIYEKTQAKTEYVSYPLTLAEDEYFVMGDHRENSKDSRNFGPIQTIDIEGKLIFVFRYRL